MQFTVNDRVRVIKNDAGVDEGETGTIITIFAGGAGPCLSVELDHPGGVSVVMYPDELELELENPALPDPVLSVGVVGEGTPTDPDVVEVDVMAITRSFCR